QYRLSDRHLVMKNAPWNFPQHFSFFDAEAHRAIFGADDDLILSGEVDERGRSVSGRIVDCAPNQFAVAFVNAEDGFSVSCAALNDKVVTQDEGRGGNSIGRNISMILD